MYNNRHIKLFCKLNLSGKEFLLLFLAAAHPMIIKSDFTDCNAFLILCIFLDFIKVGNICILKAFRVKACSKIHKIVFIRKLFVEFGCFYITPAADNAANTILLNRFKKCTSVCIKLFIVIMAVCIKNIAIHYLNLVPGSIPSINAT